MDELGREVSDEIDVASLLRLSNSICFYYQIIQKEKNVFFAFFFLYKKVLTYPFRGRNHGDLENSGHSVVFFNGTQQVE